MVSLNLYNWRWKMQKMQFLKPGTRCVDRATKLEGALIDVLINMGGDIMYLFQPTRLTKSGEPAKKTYVPKVRLDHSKHDNVTVAVPFAILGTQVTAQSSGFTGMAYALVLDSNQSWHVGIQPEGVSEIDGEAISPLHICLGDCEGDAVKSAWLRKAS